MSLDAGHRAVSLSARQSWLPFESSFLCCSALTCYRRNEKLIVSCRGTQFSEMELQAPEGHKCGLRTACSLLLVWHVRHWPTMDMAFDFAPGLEVIDVRRTACHVSFASVNVEKVP